MGSEKDGQQRALDQGMLADHVFEFLEDEMQAADSYYWPGFHGIYSEQAGQYVVLSKDGRLYKRQIIIAEDDSVMLGDEVAVQLVHVEMQNRKIEIKRQDDGSYHYALLSAVPVINRANAIDSTELLQSFVERIKESGEYPKLDFFHFRDAMKIGEAYEVMMLGNVYVELGKFDDTPFARSVAQTIQANPEEWGTSIDFYADEYSREDVGEGVLIDVFRKGTHKWTAILPQNDAAHPFTMAVVSGETRKMAMSEREEKAFLAAAAFMDDDQKEALLAGVREVNDLIDSNQVVYRMTLEEVEEGSEATEESEEAESATEETETDTETSDDASESEVEDDTTSGTDANVTATENAATSTSDSDDAADASTEEEEEPAAEGATEESSEEVEEEAEESEGAAESDDATYAELTERMATLESDLTGRFDAIQQSLTTLTEQLVSVPTAETISEAVTSGTAALRETVEEQATAIAELRESEAERRGVEESLTPYVAPYKIVRPSLANVRTSESDEDDVDGMTLEDVVAKRTAKS